jgi:cytochrome P450
MMRPKSAMVYIDSIEEISEELLDRIDKQKDPQGEIEDVTEQMYFWALESISSIFLNTRLGCLGEEPSGDGRALINASQVVLGRDMFKLVTRPPVWKFIPLPSFRRFDKANEVILEIAKKYVMNAVHATKEDSSEDDKKSVLEKLMGRSDGDCDIPVMMALDAMMAGVDTTGNTAAFIIYHLATNQEKQETLYREIMEEVGEKRVTEASLKKMRYLKACLQESLRLLPTVSGLGRRTQVDLNMGGYFVPKRTNVIYFAVNNLISSANYRDPERFVPAAPILTPCLTQVCS